MTDTLRPAPDHVRPLCNDLLSYDRDAISPGIVHIGVGGFHRAHQAVYLHELAQRGVADWGVIGVGLHSRAMKDALEPQDLLYTVIQRGGEGEGAEVVGALHSYLFAPDDPEAVYAALADPRVRIVTLTVTGGAYHVDPDTGALDADAADVVADLAGDACCRTFHAYIVEGLRRRRAAGERAFTVLSCDNVPSNGETARVAIVGYARLQDPALADWIEAEVAFPNSMVDRITPDTTEEMTAFVEREFGFEDRSPVTTEPFRQWIVEDRFCNGRPPLEDVGVQFVDDVAVYELLKKRMLNGSHTALGYLGTLAGHRTTDAVMADPVFAAFTERLLEREIGPLLPPVPGIDVGEYAFELLGRLANPKMGDELSRLSRRGSTKMPCYLLPSLAEAVAQDRPHALLTLAVAGWMRYLQGEAVQDARADELRELARERDAARFVCESGVFGALAGDAAFAARLQDAYDLLEAAGPHEAIANRLGGLG